MSDQRIEFFLPGAAVRLLREGSPTAAVRREAIYAGSRPAGRGRRFFFSIQREVAEEMADYLWSLVGVVGDMTSAEREGGGEHTTALRAYRQIEYALSKAGKS